MIPSTAVERKNTTPKITFGCVTCRELHSSVVLVCHVDILHGSVTVVHSAFHPLKIVSSKAMIPIIGWVVMLIVRPT